MPLEGLRWSRDSGSALYDTPQTAVLGRAGGGNLQNLDEYYILLQPEISLQVIYKGIG